MSDLHDKKYRGGERKCKQIFLISMMMSEKTWQLSELQPKSAFIYLTISRCSINLRKITVLSLSKETSKAQAKYF